MLVDQAGITRRVDSRALEILVEDANQATKVRLAPVATRAFPLFDDRLDRPMRGIQVGDRQKLRPAEVHLCRLG